MRYNGEQVWPPAKLFTGRSWAGSCMRKHRKNMRKGYGPLVPRTYAEAYRWARGRAWVRLGFETVLQLAKGTSFVAAYEIVDRGTRTVTLGKVIAEAV